MSDIQHIDVDSDEFEGTPKALRDHVKKLQKANTDLTQQITGLKESQTATALSGVLAGFSKPERVKSALLADGVDPLNSEAVTEWIEENGNDFARAQAPANPEDQSNEAAPPAADRSPLDLSQVGNPGSPELVDVIKSMPLDLSPGQAYEWLKAKSEGR